MSIPNQINSAIIHNDITKAHDLINQVGIIQNELITASDSFAANHETVKLARSAYLQSVHAAMEHYRSMAFNIHSHMDAALA